MFNLVKLDLQIFDKILIKNLNLEIKKGQKIGIIGKNGTGKSLLVKAILNKNLKPYNHLIKNQEGKVVFYNFLAKYIDQHYSNLDFRKTVLENILEKNIEIVKARKWLANFRFFTTEEINKKVVNLSGGEKARLAIAKETLENLDLLILDEPNNNLDINSQVEIIDSLENFQGSLICISHDLEFGKLLNLEKIYLIHNFILKNFNL